MKTLITILLCWGVCSITYGKHPDPNVNPTQYYQEAYELIKGMLEGKIEPSFRDAVFLTENAYLEGNLSYDAYLLELAFMMRDVDGLRTTLNFPYPHFDKYHVYTNAALFQYFTDTITYLDTVKNSREIKYPFSYNFEDPLAEKDWQTMFVTRLMATKKGNCHSLPYLYKILADEFEVEANLALAPNHIYITHLCHDPKITWYNTELTSGTHPIDAWIQLVTYISMDAIRNGLYGLPLDDKQSIALCLVDLANGYTRKFPQNDNKFALQCLDLALAQFPVCINAMLLKLELLSKDYKANPNPELFRQINTLAGQIHRLGYDEMPKQMYQDWLTGEMDKSSDYAPYKKINEDFVRDGIDNGKPILTASNGRFLEAHWTDSLEWIGNLLYDTRKGEVVQFLEIDTADIVSRIPRDLASRWLSPDPLAGKNAHASPYEGIGNNPILFIDPDGKDIYIKDPETGKVFLYTPNAQDLYESASEFVRTTAMTLDGIIEKGWDDKFNIINSLHGDKNKVVIEFVPWDIKIGSTPPDMAQWSPQGGIITNEGDKQSPAVGLLHELSEVYFVVFDPIEYHSKMPKFEDYKDLDKYEEALSQYEIDWYKKVKHDDPKDIKKWTPSDRWIIENVEPQTGQPRSSHTTQDKFVTNNPFSKEGATKTDVSTVNTIKDRLFNAEKK